ncbi:MAG: winged helix-turn-helix transcriptional regulator [Thermoplasmata archaeon]
MPGRMPTSRSASTTPLSRLYQNDPIRQGVQRLGRKWVLLPVRNFAFLKLTRFGELRRNNPGPSARVLSRRLREMEREGLVAREASGSVVRYRLTDRGNDAALILLAFLQYGLKQYIGLQPPSRARTPGLGGQ